MFAVIYLAECDCVLDPVPELDVAEVVQQVAELELDALVDLHVEDALAVLVLPAPLKCPASTFNDRSGFEP